MAQEGNNIDIEFGAKTDDAEAKVKSLGDTIKDSIGGAGESFKGFTALSVAAGTAIEDLGKKIGEKLAENIREAVHAFSELGDEIEHTQRRIGGSAEEISALKVGLESVGISTTSYESIARRLPQVLQQHQKEFKAAGIAYTDAGGKLLSTQEIIQNITTHLENFTAGSARNQEGMALLGRSFFMMADMTEMTSERMKEATDVAQQFGLVLSQEDLEATSNFNRQAKLLQESIHGFYVVVGKELTPALTELATNIRDVLQPVFDAFTVVVETLGSAFSSLWEIAVSVLDLIIVPFKTIGDVINSIFGSGGSALTSLEFFRNFLNVILIAVIAFRTGFVTVFAVVAHVIEAAAIMIRQFAGVVSGALRLDWAGIQAAWNKGEADLAASVTKMTNKIVAEAQRGHDQMAALAAGGSLHPTSDIAKSGGGGEPPPVKPIKIGGGGDTRLSKWRDELRQIQEAEGNFFKTDLAQEEQFWQVKLNLVKTNSKADVKLRQEIRSTLFSIHKQQAQEEYASDLANIKSQTDLFQKGASEKIRIAILLAGRIKQAYGEQSKEYRAQIQEINKLEVDHLNESIKLLNMKTDRVKEHNLYLIELEKGRLESQKDLGQITDLEELTAIKVLEEKKYQIEVQAQKDKIALMVGDEEAQQAAYDRLDQMAEQHALEIQKINSNMAKANLEEINKWLKPVTDAFGTTVTGIIQGTTTIEKGFSNMVQSIVLEFDKMCMEMIAKWLATQIQMKMGDVMGTSGFGGFMGSMFGGLFGGGGSGSAAGTGVSLAGFKGSVPWLDEGTNYVPRDTLAVIHRGEAVVPAKYNEPNTQGLAVTNHFHLGAPTDMRTQQQIALQAGMAVQRARMRNG